MTTVAVTGATGFVGRHLVSALATDGDSVRGLVRPGSSMPGGNAEWVQGDIRNPEPLRSLMDGAEVVVHLAASHSPLDNAPEIITEGTRTLVRAAEESGIQRIVYLGCLGEEAAASSPYLRAKWEAEQAVRFSKTEGVVLRSSLIVGTGDGFVSSLAGLVRGLPAVPIPERGLQRAQPIDIDDLVRCLQLAVRGEMRREGPQEPDGVANVGGPMFITLGQLVDLVSDRLGVSRPKVPVPWRLVPLLSRVIPGDLYTSPRLGLFRQGVVTSPGAVQRVFGFEPRSILPRLDDYLA